MKESQVQPSIARATAYEAGDNVESEATLYPTPVQVFVRLALARKLVAVTIGVSVFAGVILNLALPTEYSATTRILTPQQKQSMASLWTSQIAGAYASALASGSGGFSLRNPNDIYIGLLHTRPVEDAIIQQFGLQGLYRAKDLTATRIKLANNTEIVSEKSGLIAITVTDTDKKRAADIANSYTNQLRDLTHTVALSEASQRRLFYEEQLKHAKEDLVNAEADLRRVGQKSGLVELDAQSKALIEELAELRAQIAAKQVQIQAIRSYSTEQNPEVQLAERELSALQAQAASLQQTTNPSGSADMDLADVRGAGLDYLKAQHELLYRQTLYDLLIRQYDAARLDEANEATVIQVVESAIPPDRKSGPHRVVIVLWMAFAGLLMVSLYILMHHELARNPRSRQSLALLRSALFHG